MDLMPWEGILEVAKHCEDGAQKYGEHNVDRGIPQHSLIDSGMRHLAKYVAGWEDEDHLRAACSALGAQSEDDASGADRRSVENYEGGKT